MYFIPAISVLHTLLIKRNYILRSGFPTIWRHSMKLLVFDGNSIINRAYYAIKGNLTAPDGMPTGAIYGFLKLYFKYL